MGFMKKSKYAVLAVLLVFACAAIAQADPASAEPNKKDPASGGGFLKDYQETEKSDPGDVLRRMMLAVSIIVILGVAAMYASKKVLPKFSQTQGKKIKVVETIHLGSRKTIHLLEIGDQQILVGSTPDRITKLTDIFPDKCFPLSQADHGGRSS